MLTTCAPCSYLQAHQHLCMCYAFGSTNTHLFFKGMAGANRFRAHLNLLGNQKHLSYSIYCLLAPLLFLELLHFFVTHLLVVQLLLLASAWWGHPVVIARGLLRYHPCLELGLLAIKAGTSQPHSDCSSIFSRSRIVPLTFSSKRIHSRYITTLLDK